jgi:molybdopterin molybdotransferase
MGREDARRVLAEGSVTPGKNVGRRGEDVRAGATLLRAGRRLRAQDVGLLASVGRPDAAVVAAPRVRILVTGNELLAPGERPEDGRIADSNTPMLRALVRRDGGDVASALRLADDAAAIRAALGEPGFDLLVAAGGTSVGREDHLPVLVRELGRLDVHGVAMRPSSPTGIGTIGATRVLLLPGNPVSCLAAYDFFAGPAIRRLAGLPDAWPYPVRRTRLAAPLSSQVGRVDYCRVTLDARGATPLAVAGASVLSSTTRADGFVVVPAGSEGFPEGAEVDVLLYDLPPREGA